MRETWVGMEMYLAQMVVFFEKLVSVFFKMMFRLSRILPSFNKNCFRRDTIR